MTVNECAALLRENDNYLIITHTRPDGDTLCSAGALCSALRRAGKRAFLYANPGITENYLPYTSAYITKSPDSGAFCVCVDTATENLFPDGFIPAGKIALCIDHHGSNSFYAENTLLDPDMAACGELVLRVIEALCGNVTREEADLLYIALSTDCGCFCYANTNAAAFRDAAHLLDLGANNGGLNKAFFRSVSPARLALEGMIYSTMRCLCGGKLNIAVITREMLSKAGATENDCEDLASLPGKVKGNMVAVTVRELPDGRARASVRTGPEVNACEICARFGGGGHPMAAGCTSDLPPEELAGQIADMVKELLEPA